MFSGTGTNACYIEKIENVESWDGDDDDPREVSECFMLTQPKNLKVYEVTNEMFNDTSVQNGFQI